MKYILLILTFVSLSAAGQTKRIGATEIDSIYAKLEAVSTDTTNFKPVVQHVPTGKLKTMAWVGGSGGGGGITGSGTTNYVPKWSSGSALGNSALYQDGGSLVMGSTTGEGAFRILSSGNGNNYMVLENSSSGSSAQSNFAVKSNTGDYTLFGTYNSGTTATGVHSSGSGQIMTTATRLAFSANNASGEIMFGAGTNAPQRMAIGTSGVTINSSSNAYTLPTARPASNGYVLTGNTDGTTSWAAGGGGGGGTVSGTTNQIAKFTSSSAVGDGLLTDNGTRIGISPTEGIFHLKQGVAGNMYLLVENTTANAAAQASIGLKNDQGQYFLMSAYSSTTTASGIFAAGAANIYSGLTNGLAIGAASGPIVFGANQTSETLRFSTVSGTNYINFGGVSGSSDYGFRNNAGTMEYKNSGGSWSAFSGGGGGGMTNPMTTAGDLIYGGSGGTPTRLAAGTDTYVLKMVSGVPAWAVDATGGGGGTDFYTTDGTLTSNRSVAGGGFSLSLGTSGSALSQLNVFTNVTKYDGRIIFKHTNPDGTSNYTISASEQYLALSTGIAANRTITMPTATNNAGAYPEGAQIVMIMRNSANTFHWSLNAGINDIKTGTTFTQLEWGSTYTFMVIGATWYMVNKY